MAVWAGGAIAVHAGTRRTRSLTLTPRLLILPGPMFLQRRIRWVDVRSVEVGQSTLAGAVIRVEVRRPRGQRNVRRAVYAERFSVGAAATFQLLRFYHEHPALRPELGDERAVDRLLSYRLLESGPFSAENEPVSW
ncbi:hypothetical protein [Nocardia lasii]|uniref:Uncharacterized protein n=1 Tax=Nocardia lasii TaxID=1616107 RepID=A0ABW1JRN4_9NOCA